MRCSKELNVAECFGHVERAWVAANDDEIKILAELEELVMLFMGIVNKLAAHSSCDHSWFVVEGAQPQSRPITEYH